jgi:hypothetical protein
MAGTLQPGDVIAVRTSGFGGFAIRLGAALTGKPNLQNHIAIVHHTDKAGTLWCIEGRPGGVGWADATRYISSPWTVSNSLQAKSPDQRKLVCDGAVALIGKGYDWEAIAADAAADLDLSGIWRPQFGKSVPGHVVCSSLAEWLYMKALLDCPAPRHGAREIQPADWTEFFVMKGWA